MGAATSRYQLSRNEEGCNTSRSVMDGDIDTSKYRPSSCQRQGDQHSGQHSAHGMIVPWTALHTSQLCQQDKRRLLVSKGVLKAGDYLLVRNEMSESSSFMARS